MTILEKLKDMPFGEVVDKFSVVFYGAEISSVLSLADRLLEEYYGIDNDDELDKIESTDISEHKDLETLLDEGFYKGAWEKPIIPCLSYFCSECGYEYRLMPSQNESDLPKECPHCHYKMENTVEEFYPDCYLIAEEKKI